MATPNLRGSRQSATDGDESDPKLSPARPGRRPMTRGRRIRRRTLGALAAGIALFGLYFSWSFSTYVRDSNGEPTKVLLAEWGRDHHLGWFVAQAENVYYAHVDTVKDGGEPTISTTIGDHARPAPSPTAMPAAHASKQSTHASTRLLTRPPNASRPRSARPIRPRPPAEPSPAHLSPPPTVVSPVRHPLNGEGVWQPVGAPVRGVPAIYATRVRADDVHTSVLASMMWIDTLLTKALFVPGYVEPGGPSPSGGALPKPLDSSVLANVNGAFRLQDTHAGYYFRGVTVRALAPGKASAVLRADGSIAIGSWGRDVRMGPGIVAVRQNLNLIVDGGRSMVDQRFSWGATTHGETFAWRSALGERPDGSIVYIGSPGLSAAGMANTLVRAGVQRAMVLDMNNWWVAAFYFDHGADGSPTCSKLDPAIQGGCDRFLNRYKRDSFQFLARY